MAICDLARVHRYLRVAIQIAEYQNNRLVDNQTETKQDILDLINDLHF